MCRLHGNDCRYAASLVSTWTRGQMICNVLSNIMGFEMWSSSALLLCICTNANALSSAVRLAVRPQKSMVCPPAVLPSVPQLYHSTVPAATVGTEAAAGVSAAAREQPLTQSPFQGRQQLASHRDPRQAALQTGSPTEMCSRMPQRQLPARPIGALPLGRPRSARQTWQQPGMLKVRSPLAGPQLLGQS